MADESGNRLLIRPTIRAILFDLDGTLVDTESLSDQAMLMAWRPYLNADCWNDLYHAQPRHRLPWDLKKQILGLKGSDWAPIVIRYATERWGVDPSSSGLPTEQELWDAWERNLNDLCEQVEACIGAYGIVERFAQLGLPMAIVTSSRASAAAKKLARHPRIRQHMTVVAGDDPAVERGKPAPDMYLEAAHRLHVPPEACLVFEDAISGCQAGKAAGCAVVAIPDERFTATELAAFEQHADFVINDLRQFDESKLDFGSNR